MPKISHSIEIHAPLARLWSLLEGGAANPGRFLAGIRHAEVLERQAGSLLRRIETDDFAVVERVTLFEKRREIDFVLQGEADYAGQSKQRIDTLYETDMPGLPLNLHYSLDWRRKDHAPDDLDLEGWIESALRRIKAEAEAG